MNYKIEKDNLENRIDKLSSISQIEENILLNLHSLKDEISEDLTFNVLCTGEFNAGKSTFINSFFIKRDVLPVKAMELTAKLTFVKYSENEKIVIFYKDGNQEIINEVKSGILEKYLARGGSDVDNVDFVEVYINSDVLKDGITIIDSPGLNAPENGRMQLTNEFIPKADAVLYLMSALQAWKGTEKEFLEEKILTKEDLDKIFFLVNYCDVLENEEEEKEIIDFVNQQMQKSLVIAERDLGKIAEIPPIIPISAKTKKNFEALDSELINYLSSKKGIDILEQKLGKFELIKNNCLKLLNKKIELYATDKEKLNEEVKDLQLEIDSLKKEASKYKNILYPKIDKVVENWLYEMEIFYREFGSNIINRIEKYREQINDLNDLDEYLKRIINRERTISQRKLNLIEKIFLKEIEKISDTEKAKLDLDIYAIKKNSENVYDLQKSIKAEIIQAKSDEYIPEIATGSAVSLSALAAMTGAASSILIVSLPVIGAGIYFYLQKRKENILKSINKTNENIEDFIDDEIGNILTKKDDMIEFVLERIKNDIVQAYEAKEKQYQEIIKKYEDNQIEDIKELKLKISNI